MNWQTLQLLGILLNPRITAKPLRVLCELRRRGIERLPAECYGSADGRLRHLRLLAFVRHWLEGEMLSRHQGQWVLNSFLPPFPSPAFDRLFENLLSGRHLSPVSVFLAVTATCPHNCWHCSARERRNGHLSVQTWRAAIESLQALGTSIIGFTGGEPLTRADLPELVVAARQAGAATIVFGAGAGMDATLARRLKAAGLWAFCVSLDHPEPDEHDRMRGLPGSHRNALAALRLARETGFYTMVSSVATRHFVERKLYQRIYALARELGVQEYRIVEPMPCGKLAGAGDEALLTPSHVAELREFHVTTNHRGRLPKVCAFNQVESPEFFGCGGGTQHLYIDSAGEVCPCDFTPLSFGNIREAPLGSIWRRMNRAMGGNPRRHCFIQQNHQRVQRHAGAGFPLSPELSEKVCAEADREPLPDFLARVTGQRTEGSGSVYPSHADGSESRPYHLKVGSPLRGDRHPPLPIERSSP